MAIPKFTEDLEIISKLGDNPGTDNNLTAAELRAKFDAAALLLQKFINDTLIPAANASSSPQDGLTMQGPIDMGGQKLSGLNDPKEDGDASTKKYVDDTVRDVSDAVNTHKDDKNNPHAVTAAQVGARPDTWMPTAVDTGAVEMKLMWTNASPGSNFAAQTISLSLSGYAYVAIDYRPLGTSLTKRQFCKVGEACLMDAVSGNSGGGMSGTPYGIWRQAEVKTTGVVFTKAVKREIGASASITDDNGYMKPFRIFGIKGVT